MRKFHCEMHIMAARYVKWCLTPKNINSISSALQYFDKYAGLGSFWRALTVDEVLGSNEAVTQRKEERIWGFAGTNGIVNTILPRAHPWPTAKISPERGTQWGRCAQGWHLPVVWALSVSAIQEGCVCFGHVSISGARGLGTVKWEVPTLIWAVCAPLCLWRLQQIRVCFNHFAATERSRHFQGLTHLTCFRNVPGDEANCIPEGLFPLLPPRRHLAWFSQMQIPVPVTGATQPAPVWAMAAATPETKHCQILS